MRRIDPAAMPATHLPVETVASLLITIRRDDSGVFSTSVEALPPAPHTAQAASLPAYTSEFVETEALAATPPQSARTPRWRRCLVAAAAVAALAGTAVALHSPARAPDPQSSPAPTPATTSSKAPTPSSASCPDAGGSACSDSNPILPGLDAACTNLLARAARALDEDPPQWAQSVLVTTVRTGKPFADVIRQWLAGTRADVLATRYAAVDLDTILQGIDSALALAATGACSPHTATAAGPVDAAWAYP